MNRRQTFLSCMRYVAVIVVTVVLSAFMTEMVNPDDFGPGFLILAAAIIYFYITVPIIGFWVYSFAKAVTRRTATDRILLCVHIADLIILGFGAYFASRPPLKCDAFIMAQNCKGETGFWMRDIAHRYRGMLPDTTQLYVEFDKVGIPHSDILSEKDMKNLKRELADFCGCIGIEIDSPSRKNYSTLLFRRIGMGLYAFRLYDYPLTDQQQDSLNADPCMIVCNDSTVFEFRSGVLGAQSFPGKQEYVETQNKSKINGKYMAL